MAKAQPKTTMPNLLINFIITKIFHSKTTLDKLAETERLPLKFVKCRMRIQFTRLWRGCRLEPLVICLLFSTDDSGPSIFSSQYKIHTHNILYIYDKVQLLAFHILQILRLIYFLYIYPKIFFVLLFPEQKSYQSSKFQAI